MKSRSEPLIMWSWVALISCMVYGRGFPPVQSTLLAVVSTACIAISVYTYNDLIDRDMDSLNSVKKNRPIVSGIVSPEFAQKFVYVMAIIGLGIALSINLSTFISSLTFFTLFFIYSLPGIRLKKVFFVREVIIGLGFPLCSIIGSLAVSGTLHLPSIFTGVLCGVFIFLIEPGLSSSFDVKEDEIYEVKTLARALSWKRQVQWLGIAVLFMMTVTPLTYQQLGFSTLLPIVVVALSLFTLNNIFSIYGSFEQAKVLKVRKIFKIYIFAVQFLLVISSMDLSFLPFF